MSLISSAGNNFSNITTNNINHNNNVSFQSNPQNNTQIRNPDAPQAVPQRDKTNQKKQDDGNIAGGFVNSKFGKVNSDENFGSEFNSKVDAKTLQESIEKIQQRLLLNSNKDLEFVIDKEKDDNFLVKIMDKAEDKIIIQIPSETALRIANSIKEFQKFQEGLILSEKI